MDAHDWNDRYAAMGLIWSEEPNQFVADVVQELTAGRALDLACGEGRNAIWLARQGWTVTAVDFSDVAIDKARRLGAAAGVAVDWRCADIAIWEPSTASFDLVLLSYLHLPDKQMSLVIANGRRALASAGLLLVVGHARANLTGGVGGPQDPDVLYEPDDILAELDDLEVLRAEHVVRTVATDSGPRQAIDTLVLARTRAE